MSAKRFGANRGVVMKVIHPFLKNVRRLNLIVSRKQQKHLIHTLESIHFLMYFKISGYIGIAGPSFAKPAVRIDDEKLLS